MNKTQPAVFVDRDGTIIEYEPYLADIADARLIPSAIPGLLAIQELGLPIVMVTNQSAVGRGIIDEKKLGEIHKHVNVLLNQQCIYLSGEYYCPHLPTEGCDCRKPSIGMLLQASADLDIDLEKSFMVGDNASDIECGMNASVTTFLVRTGLGSKIEREALVKPDYTVDSIQQASEIIASLLVK